MRGPHLSPALQFLFRIYSHATMPPKGKKKGGGEGQPKLFYRIGAYASPEISVGLPDEKTLKRVEQFGLPRRGHSSGSMDSSGLVRTLNRYRQPLADEPTFFPRVV